MFFNQVKKFFTRRAQEKALAFKLYQLCEQQGRNYALYRDFALEDSVQIRFEFITAHLWLAFRFLKKENQAHLTRKIAEHFFSLLDASLREEGEGDLAVPRRMKTFAQAFYGRLAAYDKALGEEKLTSALASNLFDSGSPPAAFKDYFTRQIKHLEGFSLTLYQQGQALFVE